MPIASPPCAEESAERDRAVPASLWAVRRLLIVLFCCISLLLVAGGYCYYRREVNAIRPVPGSPWFMVAKIDASEILVEARYRGAVTLLLVALAILLTGGMAALVFNYRQRSLYQDLYRAERQRRETQEEIRTTLYSIGDAVIAADAAACVARVNPMAEQLTGWCEAEALGRPLEEVFRIINEQTRKEVENPAARVIREGTVVGLANHTLLIARDGSERPIADSGAPIRNEEGRITGVVLVFRDQVKERAAQIALVASEMRYRRLFESAQDGIMILDADTGHVVDVNPFLLDLLGYAREELLGKELWEIGLFQDIAASQHAFRELQEHGYIRYADLALETSNGRRVQVEFVSNVYLVNNAKVIQCNIRDISDCKRAEEALRESERRRAEAEKLAATGRMAARVAHEINNPLAGIKSAFRLIRDAVPKDHPDRDMVERIEREIERLTRVVRQMYELHSPRTQTPREILVGQTVRDVLAMLEPLCQEHEVTIETGPIPSELRVWAPEGSLQQVLYNLTVNAVQASPRGEIVNISANGVDKGDVTILIRDHGHGIPTQLKEQVFEPFFSVGANDVTEQRLGLGLSIVKNIVSSVGGRIEFESTVGKGTCFHVYLPSKQS